MILKSKQLQPKGVISMAIEYVKSNKSCRSGIHAKTGDCICWEGCTHHHWEYNHAEEVLNELVDRWVKLDLLASFGTDIESLIKMHLDQVVFGNAEMFNFAYALYLCSFLEG